ncbi:MAG: DUF2304 domain-containing protein [Propionibacteriaceae bacterium]|jgi:hypothetical protein|nr:DUF2304 domain-containing protein [Propionibacteriaceae bacterium]
MRLTIFFLIVAIGIIVGVLLLLRSRKLKEKYAALWIIVGVLSVILACFPRLLFWAARFVGIEVPSNLLFALALLLVLSVCLHLSLEVSRQEERLRRLAEEAAIQREETERCVRALRRLNPASLPAAHEGAGELGSPEPTKQLSIAPSHSGEETVMVRR